MITFVNQDDSAISLPIHIDARRIADFCRRHDIVRLCLFGSVLRDDFGPDRDIDVLVAFSRQVRRRAGISSACRTI